MQNLRSKVKSIEIFSSKVTLFMRRIFISQHVIFSKLTNSYKTVFKIVEVTEFCESQMKILSSLQKINYILMVILLSKSLSH